MSKILGGSVLGNDSFIGYNANDHTDDIDVGISLSTDDPYFEFVQTFLSR